MGRSLGGSAIHGSASHTGVTVPIASDLLAQLEALPDKRAGGYRHQWSAADDAALLRYWDTKPQRMVAKLIGVSENTARNRIQELREKGK